VHSYATNANRKPDVVESTPVEGRPLTLDGTYLDVTSWRRFESFKEAERHTSAICQNIGRVVRHRGAHSGGYVWRLATRQTEFVDANEVWKDYSFSLVAQAAKRAAIRQRRRRVARRRGIGPGGDVADSDSKHVEGVAATTVTAVTTATTTTVVESAEAEFSRLYTYVRTRRWTVTCDAESEEAHVRTSEARYAKARADQIRFRGHLKVKEAREARKVVKRKRKRASDAASAGT
jgi:hypothetical protein